MKTKTEQPPRSPLALVLRGILLGFSLIAGACAILALIGMAQPASRSATATATAQPGSTWTAEGPTDTPSLMDTPSPTATPSKVALRAGPTYTRRPPTARPNAATRPPATARPPTSVPVAAQEGSGLCAPGVTAICGDGSVSRSASRSGTCSHHKGVARWC